MRQRGELVKDNVFIGWMDGYGVAETEDGKLFCGEMPEEYAVLGEAADILHMTPVEEMPEPIRSAILKAFAG